MRPTTWLPLGMLALLVGLTFWLNALVQPGGLRADGSQRHDPDLIVENFRAVRLGEDGRVLHALAARRMVHFPDDDSAILDEPRFQAFEPGQPRLFAQARSGRVESGGERVWIEHDVRIDREGDERAEAVRIETAKLLLLPDEGIARTGDEVRLSSESAQARAQGFELRNRERTLRLDRVSAAYKPPRASGRRGS